MERGAPDSTSISRVIMKSTAVPLLVYPSPFHFVPGATTGSAIALLRCPPPLPLYVVPEPRQVFAGDVRP